MRATEFVNKQQGVAEDTLNEFATDSGGGGDDILKTLAAQWLNGDVSSGDLDSDIQSQEKVERRLEKGVTCPDGVKRKLYIDYSDDYKGVVIYGDDNWSITYKQDDLSESHQGVAEGLGQDIPSVLYHATYKPRLKSIKLKGLGAGGKRNWEDSQRGVVYLALDPNVAESYAETSDMVPEEWLDQIVILKISTAGLDPNKFGIDSNVQDNSGDTVEYHGVIPVSNISLYKQGVAEGWLNEASSDEAWELVGQPVPEIQQFVKQMGYGNDEQSVGKLTIIIDSVPSTQISAANISKLKNLANKGNDVQTLKAVQQISGKPDAEQQYIKLMQARDAGEGRNRDVSGYLQYVKSGNYDPPVLLKLPTGVYVIGGRTRLYAALALGVPANVKIISANNFKQGVAEGRSKDFAERHYAAKEIEKIIENLLSSESLNVTPEIFKKIKELVAITGRSQDIRYFGSAGELIDKLTDVYRQSQIRSGQMPQFTGRAAAARDMARQIANQTRGTYRYFKPQTWTTRFGQRYRDPADYVVYPDQQSYDDALEWIENKGKKVRYRDNSGGLTDATQIGSYIIEPSTFTQDAFSDTPQTTHRISVRLAKTINQGGRQQVDITDQQAAALQDIASTKSQNAIQSIQLILKVLQGEQDIKQIIDNSKKITPQDKAKLDAIITGAKNFQEPNQGVSEAWSEKYKRSINCDKPKGFSQRAHCQGRKKNNEQIELDERKKKRKTTKKTNRYFYGPVYYGGFYGTGDSSGDGGGGE